MSALVELVDLTVAYAERGGERRLKAVDGVSLSLARGSSAALVGESGSGKSTLARALAGLVEPEGGAIRFDGREVASLSQAERFALRRRVQLVFQDPFASLDPRLSVEELLGEPLEIHRVGDARARRARSFALLEAVGLSTQDIGRYPHEFSGGQRQRLAIARALALEPELLILDEPTSALDVSVQAQILNLLASLRERFGLAYLFITHDLSLVHQMCERVAVMYFGRVVEENDVAAFFREPLHPYSKALVALARRAADARTLLVSAEAPSPFDLPPGCSFHPRCPRRAELGSRCVDERPALERLGRERAPSVACHLLDSERAR
ncbi:MAG: ATP-binding cassette domain-containing protein [Planctomycetes bacterium]|jgi:oligopeptide/dipeptide ABC transporter ATP-binding protein|nr:ATP-binding cassette domain-containing protein [Planctomycetota bacterium]